MIYSHNINSFMSANGWCETHAILLVGGQEQVEDVQQGFPGSS